MAYTLSLLFSLFVLGMVGVSCNPSPYFAALGLVMVAGVGSGALALQGGTFLSLVLFLIYLGGMLVVFAYSVALSSDLYPEGWGTRRILLNAVVLMGFVLVLWVIFCNGCWKSGVGEVDELHTLDDNVGGVSLMYSSGGGMLVISAWVLLLTLFAVLELTRGLNRGALRAV